MSVTYGWSCFDNSQLNSWGFFKENFSYSWINQFESDWIQYVFIMGINSTYITFCWTRKLYYTSLSLIHVFYLDSTQKQWFYCKSYYFCDINNMFSCYGSKCQISNGTSLKMKNFLSSYSRVMSWEYLPLVTVDVVIIDKTDIPTYLLFYN